ncbi:MAG: DUF934 domain-containing protein [Pseudomonadota bacterium]
MAKIIKDKQIVEDQWLTIKLGAEGASPEIPVAGNIIVPLKLWLAKKAELQQRQGQTGVWLDSNEEPAPLADDLPNLPLIAINFPQFADGRGYSIARLLRERFGFKGEMRAIGDVLRDQIFYMHRCGFNAFEVRADKSIEDALTAFNDFSDGYQTSVDQPVPYFRRRLSGGN